MLTLPFALHLSMCLLLFFIPIALSSEELNLTGAQFLQTFLWAKNIISAAQSVVVVVLQNTEHNSVLCLTSSTKISWCTSEKNEHRRLSYLDRSRRKIVMLIRLCNSIWLLKNAVFFFPGEYAKRHMCQSIAITSSTQF